MDAPCSSGSQKGNLRKIKSDNEFLQNFCRYIKAAADGETIVIDCSTLKAGSRLAFLGVEITKKQTGELVARGSHTKFIGS
jgi:acyl-coenzyme A thioesterase PaaI-like protein